MLLTCLFGCCSYFPSVMMSKIARDDIRIGQLS